MRVRNSLFPTLKEDPSDAEVISHKLMIRAGLIRQLAAGLYTFLPMGWRAMLKAIRIIREEMDAIGGQEIYMPALNPVELWEETGRAKDMGEILFRFKDRKERELVLAPTHEEIIADIARREIRSFRDLPQIWYQIQEKFRDEPRSRFGLLRVREFLMKDSYSLCADWEQLDEIYKLHEYAYRRIFTRCGLKFVVVGASTGLMGGKQSQEFMVESDAGEDMTAFCEKCGYAANTEIATGTPQPFKPVRIAEKKKVHTPDLRTVEEVSEFLGLPPAQMLKSLVYVKVSDGKPVMVLIRGDYQLNEEKLAQHMGGAVRPATADEVLKWIGAPIGFVGPVDLPESIKIIADDAFPRDVPFATGANEEDYHVMGYKLDEIRVDEWGDFRTIKEGDRCPSCGNPLKVRKTIEIGHIFKLGTKYSEAMGATFLDSAGNQKPIVMGSYGIGVGRILAAAIELYADESGIVWPITIAPFEVIITAIDITKPEIKKASEQIYGKLMDMGVDVLFDDRDERAGVKFKDADLWGIPIRVVVGKKVADGLVEVSLRRKPEDKIAVKIDDAPKKVLEMREILYREIDEKLTNIEKP